LVEKYRFLNTALLLTVENYVGYANQFYMLDILSNQSRNSAVNSEYKSITSNKTRTVDIVETKDNLY